MPENEFEKKVSSEMQDLRFKPSDNVWQGVEERIKKKKKRRVFIIIFFLAGFALLGYWQRSNLLGEQKSDIAKTVQKGSSGEKQKEKNSESTKEINNSSAIKQNIETTKSEETKNTIGKTEKNDKAADDRSIADKKDIGVSNNEISKQKKSKEVINEKPGFVKTKKDNKPEASIAIVSAISKTKNGVVDDPSKDLKTNPETNPKQEEIVQTEVKPVESKIDSAKAVSGEQEKSATTKEDTLLKADPTKDPAPQVVKRDPSEKKWKWGLHITPGISSLNDNSISLGGSQSFAALDQNAVGSGTASPPPPRQKPSDVKAGFAFQVGAFAQRQVSSRTSLSVGLQYGYYSNVLHIGNRRGSLNNNTQFYSALGRNNNQVYNAGSDTMKYTNSYHFMELPLLFQWQLNKNKTKPFIWSTGFTVGQLISSNAIMYDTAFNGVYYKNKSQLNKTQFSLSTGLSWTIANNKQMQWNLGPVVNFHLTKLIDNPFENKRYLFFVGLRTGVVFNSKK